MLIAHKNVLTLFFPFKGIWVVLNLVV